MWHLKFKCRHSDCIYAPKLKELKLSVFFHHLGYYTKGNSVRTSALQYVVGEQNGIEKYVRYLKSHDKISKIEAYGNVILSEAKHGLKVYAEAYNPVFMHPAPAYLSRDGFEIVEVACWERKPLEKLIGAIKSNETTTHFEILDFREKMMDDVYVSRLLPKLSKKQNEAVRLAFRHGYYRFPRQTNLGKLAKMSGVSKATFRENLRRAESRLMPNLFPE